MSWIKFDEQPLVASEASSPKTVTEYQDVPNEIRMFRGTTTMAFTVDQVALAVSDVEARKKWVERMADDVLFEGSFEEGEWLSYESYDLIWPVSNRDYVFRQTHKKSTVDGKAHAVVSVTSITHPDYPVTADRVRGLLPTCLFTLDELATGETHVEVVVQVDPGGSLPGFVKNMIQKGWSLKTLRALNTYLVTHHA